MAEARTVVVAIDDSEYSEYAFDCKYIPKRCPCSNLIIQTPTNLRRIRFNIILHLSLTCLFSLTWIKCLLKRLSVVNTNKFGLL